MCAFPQTQPDGASLHVIRLSHLYVFIVECHFAVFAVQTSRLTFSLIVSFFLRLQDEVLAGFALYTLEFTAAFVLSLSKRTTMHFSYQTVCCSHAEQVCLVLLQLLNIIWTDKGCLPTFSVNCI